MAVNVRPKKMARETVLAARRGERVDARTAERERRAVARSRWGRGQFCCGYVSAQCIRYIAKLYLGGFGKAEGKARWG
jgi:hypothetical protein